MTASDVDFANKRKQVSQERRNQSNVKKNQLNTKIHEYDFNLNFERRFNKFNKDENQMTFNLQIYKFLIHFYDVNCPAYKKFHIEPEKPIKKVPHYDWPFLDVPTKPRSVFDSGPTREEVGEYNRRIFDLITQNTFPYPRKIVYRCNPNFYDGDVPNELHEQIFKIDVEIYKYNGDAFIYDDRVTLRIYSINELKYMSLKNKQGNINLNAEIQDFKFVTEEHGKFIDVLFLQDFVIYRFVFRDRYLLESVMRLVV
jgi:hypothetical protein